MTQKELNNLEVQCLMAALKRNDERAVTAIVTASLVCPILEETPTERGSDE